MVLHSPRRRRRRPTSRGDADIAEPTDIPLAEAIKHLRDELIAAAQEGVGKDVRFRMGPITLDLQIAAERTAGANAGIMFWLVSIGGKAEATNARTHTVHLELHPLGPTGKDLVVGGRSDQMQG